MERKPLQRQPSPLGHYFSNTFAGLTAQHITSAGQTQVIHARIRDSVGQVFPVRIEGCFVSGAIAHGDSITFGLRIVDGTYVVTDGQNHTTREAIRLRR